MNELTSDQLDFFLLLGLIILTIIYFKFGLPILRRKRADTINAYASEKGLSFQPGPPSDLSRFYQFTAFGKDTLVGKKPADTGMAINTITGVRVIAGRTYKLQAGYYRVHLTNPKRTDYYPYVLLTMPFNGIPKLIIREEDFLFDKFSDDIDFKGDPISIEFSKRFFVSCPEQSFAHEVIQTDVMRLFLSKKHVNWLEMDQDTICLYHEPWGHKENFAHMIGIEPLVSLMSFMEELVTALPDRFTAGNTTNSRDSH